MPTGDKNSSRRRQQDDDYVDGFEEDWQRIPSCKTTSDPQTSTSEHNMESREDGGPRRHKKEKRRSKLSGLPKMRLKRSGTTGKPTRKVELATHPVDALSIASNVSIISMLPLPSGWEMEFTSDGAVYYINHNMMSTHWCHPLERDAGLPVGWENVCGPAGVVYLNHITREATYKHPASGSHGAYIHTPEELQDQSQQHCQIMRSAAGYTPGHILLPPFLGQVEDSCHKCPEWLEQFAVDPSSLDPMQQPGFRSDHIPDYLEILRGLFMEEQDKYMSIANLDVQVAVLDHLESRQHLALSKLDPGVIRHKTLV